ncbi:MAG: hypothetical protein GXY32_02610 [Ruminococcaceae bacterium]|nr:hypothetical protein [Oscillospiraceae bacterium]
MAEQQGYEYEQFAPQTGGRLFSNAMFGFNKEEVLEYLDELADENYQRQEAAEMRSQELTQRLAELEAALAAQQAQLAEAAEAGANALPTAEWEADQARLAELGEELDIAKAATQQAEEDLAEVRDQLYNLQQENAWLREEYQKNEVQLADMHRQLDQMAEAARNRPQNAEAEKQIAELRQQLEEALAAPKEVRTNEASAAIIADANAEAERIRAVAVDEKERLHRQVRSSAGGLAKSITNLKGEVTVVERDVSQVLESVQTSLTDVLAALNRTEQNLNTFGVQVERFPASAAPVPKPQQQVVYFQPGQQPIGPAQTRRARNAEPAESLGQGGFQRVWPATAGRNSNLRPFRPTYSNSPTTQAAYWPQAAEAWEPQGAPEGEERIRALAETLVETLVQMLNG